jgi:hypothetical protein
MKISKAIFGIALLSIVVLISCDETSSKKINEAKEQNGNHGHSHEGDSHEQDVVIEQEEFIVEEDLLKNKDSNLVGETLEPKEIEQEDKTTIVIPAKKALEYKFRIDKHEKLTYEWIADTPLFSDFHGDPDPKEGFKKGYYESYAIATSDKMKGTATVPYSGSHGWYWKNESNKDITVSLKTKGNYKIIGLKK